MNFLRLKNTAILCIALIIISKTYADNSDSHNNLSGFRNWKGTGKIEQKTFQSPNTQMESCLSFIGPGKWQCTTTNLDWSKQARILIQFNADLHGSANLFVHSKNGVLSHSFNYTGGEQIKTIPFKVFTRNNIGANWNSITNITLQLKETGKFTLLDIQTVDKTKNVPNDGRIYLAEPISPFNSVCSAWPVYAIIDSNNYPKKIKSASQILADNLKNIFGIIVPVNPKETTPYKATHNVIAVGSKAAIQAGIVDNKELTAQGFNGFIIRQRNGSLAIAGNSIQGTSYGVYKYLERNGMKFFSANRFSTPNPSENIISVLDIKGRPFFRGKRVSAPYSVYGDSSSRMALGVPRTADIDDEFPCDKTLWIDHTAAFLVPKKIYMEKHPDYYLLRANGKRLGPETSDVRLMICPSSKGAIRIAAERAEKWMDAQSNRYYFCIQQGDSNDRCFCKNCIDKRAKGWNESDLMLNWVNTVAKKVAKKHPDKILYCFAYVDTQPPPNKLKAEQNVVVLYCPWPSKMSAPNGFKDFDAPENTIARRDLKGWIKAVGGDHLGIYDYAGGASLSHRRMTDRIKWCARNQILGGFWYCGQSSIFPKLFQYINAQLNWDPLQDTSKLEREFIHNYYGKAAPDMMIIYNNIFNRLEADPRNNKMHPCPEFFDHTFVEETLTHFNNAINNAPTPSIKSEIQKDLSIFIDIGLETLAPRGNPVLVDNQLEVFGIFLKLKLNSLIDELTLSREKAKKMNKPLPGFNAISDKIWKWTHVKINTDVEDEQTIPMRLQEMINNPTGTIKQYRITDFTEKLPNGVYIPAMAFSGACGPMYYKWKCEGKVATWIRGTMTDVSVMTANFKLGRVPATEMATLEIDGQDSDDLSSPSTPILIEINGNTVFEGPCNFIKCGWSKQKYQVPVEFLKQGKNQIRISNFAVSDSKNSYWFMLSRATLTFQNNK